VNAPVCRYIEIKTEVKQTGDNVPENGSAEWKGDVPTGAGTITGGDTISGGYTYKSRFEDGPGSNPERLIAPAHAACFSTALANVLAVAGSPRQSIGEQNARSYGLGYIEGMVPHRGGR
jgi:organic hydroperoxide reductase OsmC/OhrA